MSAKDSGMTPIEKMMAAVEWEATDAAPSSVGLPVATHSGVLHIGDLSLRCFRLDDGRAIFDANDLSEFFGGMLFEDADGSAK